MTCEQANKQARRWWGDRGTAEIRSGRLQEASRYVVGTSTLSSRLGGHVSTAFGASWKSFEAAFADAAGHGHGPTTGFENDDTLEFEA